MLVLVKISDFILNIQYTSPKPFFSMIKNSKKAHIKFTLKWFVFTFWQPISEKYVFLRKNAESAYENKSAVICNALKQEKNTQWGFIG